MRVLADTHALIIGIVCEDPDPAGIVSFSVRRDAVLSSEDHVRVVLGPFADGRSGYVFAVNPSGARYDGLINPGGESENADWDGIWQAATARLANGWSTEIRITLQTLAFKPGLHEWHFNVQRRIQRRSHLFRSRAMSLLRRDCTSGDATASKPARRRSGACICRPPDGLAVSTMARSTSFSGRAPGIRCRWSPWSFQGNVMSDDSGAGGSRRH